MIDEVSEENGPLEVLPGSHLGPLHSLWYDGMFTGSVAKEISIKAQKSAVMCLGRAGSVLFYAFKITSCVQSEFIQSTTHLIYLRIFCGGCYSMFTKPNTEYISGSYCPWGCHKYYTCNFLRNEPASITKHCLVL